MASKLIDTRNIPLRCLRTALDIAIDALRDITSADETSTLTSAVDLAEETLRSIKDMED